MKKLNKVGVSWADQIKKTVVLKCFLLFYALTKSLLDWIITCDEKWIFMTTSDDQLSGWAEKELQSTSQSQTCTKKRSWSLFGGLLPVWSTTTFWIPVKPSIWEVCLANQWDAPKTAVPSASIGQQKGGQFFSMTTLDYTLHNQHFRSWTNWATKFCLIHHIYLMSHQPATTFFKHLSNFLLWKRFHNQKEAENVSQEFVESQSMDFYATGINISCWQKCVDCNCSYFD